MNASIASGFLTLLFALQKLERLSFAYSGFAYRRYPVQLTTNGIYLHHLLKTLKLLKWASGKVLDLVGAGI